MGEAHNLARLFVTRTSLELSMNELQISPAPDMRHLESDAVDHAKPQSRMPTHVVNRQLIAGRVQNQRSTDWQINTAIRPRKCQLVLINTTTHLDQGTDTSDPVKLQQEAPKNDLAGPTTACRAR